VVKDGKECSGGCPIEKKEKARAAASVTRVVRRPADQIDVDLPFPVGEVERVAGVDYLACLDRSDIPRAGLYGRGRPTKHSVLVVDDEPVVCQSVRRILGQRQCSVDEAFDMEAALRKMKIGKYDLVILDLRMPKVSGMDVLEAIRKLHPDVPVIMVSGYATIENAIQATKLGAFQVLPKPFTPTELSRVAEEALVAA
jgi:CheY-like chemotaxis protein